MSTLKEKLFNAIFDNAWEFKTENVVPECEKIADDFAVNFARWCDENVFEGQSYREALFQFKKEKGWN